MQASLIWVGKNVCKSKIEKGKRTWMEISLFKMKISTEEDFIF